jgi:CHASE2 domain-containing sensor protein
LASKLARFSWLPGGLAATVVFAIGRLLAPETGHALETKLYDRVQRSAQVEPARDIVLVGIDAESIRRFGEWPWARDVHATLIDRLRVEGASVIAWSVPFGSASAGSEIRRLREALTLLESSGLGNSEQAAQLRTLLRSARGGDPEAHLVDAIRAHGRVVLPLEVRLAPGSATHSNPLPRSMVIGSNSGSPALGATPLRVPNDSFLQAAYAIGHSALVSDADGVVRSDVAIAAIDDDSVPSLAVAVAATALDTTPNGIFASSETLRIGAQSVALDREQRVLPQYSPPQAFKHLPYWQVWSGDFERGEFKDKIVLIGFADPDLAEANPIATPAGSNLPEMTAVASAASSLIDTTAYARSSLATGVEWGATVAVVLIAALLLPAAGLAMGTVATGISLVALAIVEIGLLNSMRVWPQLVLPGVALIAGYCLYVVGELIRRANVRSSNAARDSITNLRNLGQTFQKQGQLDLAFETYRRCPLDAPTMEALYYLGIDFERRRQNQKAAAVYGYIATRDPNYRDLRLRRARIKEEDTIAREAVSPAPPKLTRVAESQRSVPPPMTGPRPGARTLGRYEIERELGKGAMGVVYLGRDPKINRVVAIKAIPLAEEFEEEDLEEARARFFREAEMAGRLNHPSIVTVYDAGEDQGLAYIAMEYLRGQHLSYYTDPSRLLPPGKVLMLMARVADALHYAHRQNVVHRDIKPANIMFNSDTDELKITDFGIARLTDTSRTKTGIVLGTPSFMSPEQLEGRNLDGRSDQFALAVSLYQLLCGQLPFRADTMPRLMQKIATEPHPPIRSVRPELPESIEPIIDRALAKSADDRYVTCAEFGAALRAVAQQLAPAKPANAEHEWLLP